MQAAEFIRSRACRLWALSVAEKKEVGAVPLARSAGGNGSLSTIRFFSFFRDSLVSFLV